MKECVGFRSLEFPLYNSFLDGNTRRKEKERADRSFNVFSAFVF